MTTSARLLVVDDEPDLRTLYELTLLRAGYQVESAADLQTARQWLAQKTFDAVITDMRLPDGLGLELVRELNNGLRTEKCIVITAFGSPENAVEALKAGAFDYLTKPVDLKQFRTAVAAALQSARPPAASPETPSPTPTAPSPQPPPSLAASQSLAHIVGHSAVMVAVRQRIERVARSMAPVLVLGESGTGKELVARSLHACSHRAEGPFIAVNCGAIPENLLEAEFFGVRKGAYTGASHDREGYCQAAKGGTLFLDEIGDLPLPMQAKLLRAIQERQIRPLGSNQEEAIDVRFVSATHRDLTQAVRNQTFRQDLFYRLNVIELHLPPLRERREDLPDLAHSLLQRLCSDTGYPAASLSPAALAWLREQPLPGNVRELENILHRGLALSAGGLLDADDLTEPNSHSCSQGFSSTTPPQTAPPAPGSPVKHGSIASYMDQVEQELLLRTLRDVRGDLERCGQLLGMTPRQLSYRLRRLHITLNP